MPTAQRVSHRQPELLAPAGDWDAMRAAVANGADAVYFGLSEFNARHRATNFTLAELPNVIDYLHAHNVRGYVAFNTLVFSDELPAAVQSLSAIAEAGADAVIVQDLGLARLIRQLAPELPIHGSTQMTLTEPLGIEFVKRLGAQRVIVARELSLEDIERITAKTDMPLEVFVHGALCVAYSGQCLTSEALGGRSANRGQCAQACRLPYDLIVDGHQRDLGDKAYLLSPQDLAAYDLIGDLTRLGVCSLKIEGRLKSPHYVAVTTQTYRAAIEAATDERQFELPQQGRLDLEQSFSRGLTHGFLDGVNHQVLVHGRFPKSRGVRVGTVVAKAGHRVVVELERQHDLAVIKPGDGVVFDQGHPEQDEQGGRILAAEPVAGVSNRGPQRLQIAFRPGDVSLPAIELGSIVWKTDDPALRKRLEHSYARDRVARPIAVDCKLRGQIGSPLTLTMIDDSGHVASAAWAGPLELAKKHPLTTELLREQLGRLGNTPFDLATVELDLPAEAMVPKSVLNDLRRRAVELLVEQRRRQAKHPVAAPQILNKLRNEITASPNTTTSTTMSWYVLVRTLAQLNAVLNWQPPDSLARPGMVYCDFEDVRRYRDAVQLAHQAEMPIGVATLRITKPHEHGLMAPIARAEADAVLVRNLAGLVYFREQSPDTTLVGDFSLNVANELTADLFRREGLARLTPSYDLNWDQLAAMLGRIDPALFELVIHQHMPMFHMEHCVFAATMSQGKDWRDCGRPCDRHQVELRDRAGAAFPLVADTGCRNTVFNSVAQSAAEYVPRMLTLGVRHFRVELLREKPTEVPPLLEQYARVIAGLESGRGTWRQLQVLNQLGVTRGTLQLS